MSPQSLDILFLAYSLDVGGTERQLVSLANGLHARGHKVSIALFYGDGGLESEVLAAGIPLIYLRKKSRWDFLGLIWRLRNLVRMHRPSVVYSLLSTPNILSAILKVICPRVQVVWGVRSSYVDYSSYGPLFYFSERVERAMSQCADLIICNSQAGMAYATDKRFPIQKMIVVSNGIDTDKFIPDDKARKEVRAEWGVTDSEFLIGLVGRLDPMKDHATFIKSASLLSQLDNEVRFVCVGGGEQAQMQKLMQMASEAGLDRKLIWAGQRNDMPSVYNGLDLLCLSSSGEGFPNVLGEAMSCGVPCVATNVGDSALIIGQLGVIVKSNDPDALCDGMCEIISRCHKNDLDRRAIRLRIIEYFGMQKLYEATETALSSLSNQSLPR
jgi:glycosyltransferase involved in cell wall biosynthesis